MATIRINSLLLNKQVPLQYACSERVFILLSIRETIGFDKDGKPTGECVGYTVNLVDTMDFKSIKVKIPRVELDITPEELQQARENGERVFVELEESFIKMYFNSTSNTIQDSITARNFHIDQTNL